MVNYAGSNRENPEPQLEDIGAIKHKEGINSLFINKEMYAGSINYQDYILI